MINIARKNYPTMMEKYDGELLQNLVRVEEVPFPNYAKRKFYKGEDGTLIAVGGVFQDSVFMVVEKNGEVDFFLAGTVMNFYRTDAYLDLFTVEDFNENLL